MTNNIQQNNDYKEYNILNAPELNGTLDLSLVCIEDGLDNIGFRKFSAYVKSIHTKTTAIYIPTENMRSLKRLLIDKGTGELEDKDLSVVAKILAKSDIVGLSSMTHYSTTVHKLIAEIRKINSKTYIVWGGIHAIVHPEDAIKHADAVCTGEGEFAFETFLDLYKSGKDFTTAPSFWFRKDNNIIKNRNLPLMTPKEMDSLPSLLYDDKELIYYRGKGLKKINSNDFIEFTGLSYNTIWSIGCPLHCTYCANTKFIEYDNNYRRLRHSSPRFIIDEIKRAKSKHPHLSTILFHDDSFMALKYEVLEEFCKLWKEEVKMNFAIYGIIPTYVREDKVALLVDAGMNRARMGIQSGSDNILEFYKRPTKLHRIKEATEILNKFKKYMIPPAYDIILENPIETPEDTRATVDLIYNLPRPFTLNIYSLRIIPNTQLAKDAEKRGVKIPPIDAHYQVGHQRTMGNLLVYYLTVFTLPEWLYKYLRNKIYPVLTPQPHYPILFTLCRVAYLVKRSIDHIRFMDFSIIPGKAGYFLWKLGIMKIWKRFLVRHYHLPKNKLKNS